MSMSNATETDLLKLIFNNTNFANVGDATGLRGSSTAGLFYIALHTADPGEAGDQTTSEATYTGYARKSMGRSTVDFTVSGNTVSNATAQAFAACSGGSNVLTHFSLGVASSGASEMICSGALTASLAVSNGITPSFAIAALSCVAD